MNKISAIFISTLLYSACSNADETTVELFSTGNNAKSLGQVVFSDSQFGLLIKPQLSGLPTGIHGFHLHQHPDCGDIGMHARGHFDPAKTNSHQGPYGKGHLGDLPALYVGSDGKANTPILAPRLKTADLKGLAVMVHAGGDNYRDTPPLGGGGDRIACGAVK